MSHHCPFCAAWKVDGRQHECEDSPEARAWDEGFRAGFDADMLGERHKNPYRPVWARRADRAAGKSVTDGERDDE